MSFRRLDFIDYRSSETTNTKPIIGEYGAVYSVAGKQYRTVILYCEGKVYFTSTSGKMIISASFTGWSPRQNTLYVKDVRKQNLIGGIGIVLPEQDLEEPLALVNEYNEVLSTGAMSIPRIKDMKIGENSLDDMFKLEEE